MSDIAFDLIKPRLQSTKLNTLWITDENLSSAQLRSNPAVTVITNRFDLFQTLSGHDWQVEFSDFDFTLLADNSVDQILYRISKEKPVVHHIINQASRVLKPTGKLLLSGEKNEGIKSYITKARKLFDGQCDAEKADKNFWLAELECPEKVDTELYLDDQEYTQLRVTASDQSFEYISKPGQFGWDKIDQGSQFLIENLDKLLPETDKRYSRVLDLGCGYGYLSCHIAKRCDQLVATDNNCAAIASCQRNLSALSVSAEVIAANCADSIEGQFELIICNPPFHSGFNVENSLTDRFLSQTAAKLQRNGVACFVVNQHIPLERKAKNLFKSIDTVADNGSFKLVRLSNPV